MSKMRKLLIVPALVLLAAIAASASLVSVEDKEVLLGGTTTVNLTLDSAPAGLSGYNLTISLSNASIAEIISVSFPSWAILHDNSTLPADSVWIKAVDLYEQVESNATNITLAKLTIGGDKIGDTSIDVTVTKIDNDNGDPVTLSTVNSTLIVTAGNTKPELPKGGGENSWEGDRGGEGALLLTPTSIPTTQPAAKLIPTKTIPSSILPSEEKTPSETPKTPLQPTEN
jgi:hypothetical protein